MKTKAELDNKLQELKDAFGEHALTNGSIGDLRKWFKNYFNTGIVKVGDKLTFDFSGLSGNNHLRFYFMENLISSMM